MNSSSCTNCSQNADKRTGSQHGAVWRAFSFFLVFWALSSQSWRPAVAYFYARPFEPVAMSSGTAAGTGCTGAHWCRYQGRVYRAWFWLTLGCMRNFLRVEVAFLFKNQQRVLAWKFRAAVWIRWTILCRIYLPAFIIRHRQGNIIYSTFCIAQRDILYSFHVQFSPQTNICTFIQSSLR